MILVIAAALLLQSADLVVREPRAAPYWRQAVHFRCGANSLQMSGFGASRPLGGPVTITFNGRHLRGTRLGEFMRDLARTRAVYRFSGLCSPHRRGISV